MSGEIRWSNLSVCGIPITADPEHQDDDALVARDGDMLVISLQVDADGRLVGATGHIEELPDETGAA